VIYQSRIRPQQVIDPQVSWTTDQILQKVVQEGTARAANLGRPAAGKTGTAQDYTNAWFVGFVPQMVAAVWVGFPRRADIPMVYPKVRLPYVTGGSWPAQIWRAFMVNATQDLPPIGFPQPAVEAGPTSVLVDVRRNCLPNRWTLPTDVAVVVYADQRPPTRVCTVPSGPQVVDVPGVVGMSRDEATAELESWAFEVSVVTRIDPNATPGTVLSQSPPAGSPLLQGSVVKIVIPEPDRVLSATVPGVLGLTSADAILQLQAAGFTVSVVSQWQCDPKDPGCEAVEDQVWRQDPESGLTLPESSVVRIWVNRGDRIANPGPSPSPSGTPSPSPSPPP
jgi:penicillin-binding protein 1A